MGVLSENYNPSKMEVTPIEMKELRGITPKTIMWLIGCTVSIVSSVIITSGNISSKLETYIVKQDGINAIQDIRITNNSDAVKKIVQDINDMKIDLEQMKIHK